MLTDLRYSLRILFKAPGFLIVSVLTLALGIGANTAMFSVVKAVLLSQLPFPQPDRLVQLWEARKDGGLIAVSGPNLRDWQQQNRAFQRMAGAETDTVTLISANAPARVKVTSVSRDFFPLMGVPPEAGRTTVPSDHVPGGSPVVVIGHGLWMDAFAGDLKVIGRTVRMAGITFTVAGVMPAGFDFPQKSEAWIPVELFPDVSTRSAHNYQVFGRLKADASLRSAQADMNTVASRLAREYIDDKDRGIRVVSLYDQIVGPVRPALLILLGAVGFVLLVACVNVANLQLSRGVTRMREMALRGALGASRGRTVRQLLTEAVLIAAMGGVAGIAIALVGTELLRAAIPPDIPRIGDLQIDLPVLLFALVLSLSTGILFGLLPALLGSQANVIEALKEGSAKTTMSGSHRRLGATLVVSEIAIAMVLLTGAGLLIQTFRNLRNVQPGFATEGVVSAEISWSASPSDAGQSGAAALTGRLLDRVRHIPGVASAGVVSSFPVKDSGPDGSFEIAGRALPADPHQQPWAYYRVATRGYLEAMQIPLQRGRLFSDADERGGAQPVALVNQRFVREYFPQGNPLGQRIRFFGFDEHPQFLEIVGVVSDTRSLGLAKAPEAEVFADGFQHAPSLSSPTLAVRGSLRAIPQIRAAIAATDPHVPVAFQTVEEVLHDAVSRQQFQMSLISVFAALAILLSAIGIFGVESYSVNRRMGELGIRAALGADRSRLLRLVFREALTVTALGIGVGLIGSAFLTQTLASLLYGVKPNDPVVYLSSMGLLIAVMLLACSIPAHRASRVDPLVALRYE